MFNEHECIYHKHIASKRTDELRILIINTPMAD